MFGISGGEFLVLIVVAIIFLGPKHAAQAVKAIRNAMGYIRDFSSQLRSQVSAQHAQNTLEGLGITEEDLAALRKLRSTTGSLDPRAFVRKTVAEEMDAWLDIAPKPVKKATGLPESPYPTLSSVAEIKKNAAERKVAASAKEPTESTYTLADSTASTASKVTDEAVESETKETPTADHSSQKSVQSPPSERKEA